MIVNIGYAAADLMGRLVAHGHAQQRARVQAAALKVERLGAALVAEADDRHALAGKRGGVDVGLAQYIHHRGLGVRAEQFQPRKGREQLHRRSRIHRAIDVVLERLAIFLLKQAKTRNKVMAAWQTVTLKAGDQQTLDLTIDPAKTGAPNMAASRCWAPPCTNPTASVPAP